MGTGTGAPRLLDQLQLRHLRAFVAVVERGSFTSAAQSLQVSQPALSASIQRLERVLGGPVVERGRPIVLTALGLVVLNHTRQLTGVLRSLDAEITALGERAPRALRIGVFGPGGGPLTARLLEAVGTNPGLDVAITAVDLDQQQARVLDGSLHLVLTYGPCAHPDIRVTPLSREPRLAVVGRQHPLAGTDRASLTDVLPYAMPAALAGEPPEWKSWWHLLPERNGERPRTVVVPGDDADPFSQLRQAVLRSLVVLVAGHLRDALPGQPNGLHYVELVDASPATGVVLSRVDAGPVVEAVVRLATRLAAPPS